MIFSVKRLTAFILLLLTLALPVNALAQENSESDADKPKIKVLPPAYDEQMMRLSEILGALHYLRELCGANEGQQWRDEMRNLIVKEEPTDERRALMTARFNRGFRGFQETYRECTDAAIEANDRYIFEGAKLAGEIPSRYGR
jgi:uncharacterized protein (TIGR02301 family)